ncbi:MAG: sugar phosphate isomerase/epimerase, partial [Phycisphaerales bacterium]
MDRRTFVAGVGVSAASAALGRGLLAQPASSSDRRFKISLKYGMIGEGETVAEKFAIARDAGFDGVEMDSPNPFSVDEVLKAKESAGIE